MKQRTRTFTQALILSATLLIFLATSSSQACNLAPEDAKAKAWLKEFEGVMKALSLEGGAVAPQGADPLAEFQKKFKFPAGFKEAWINHYNELDSGWNHFHQEKLMQQTSRDYFAALERMDPETARCSKLVELAGAAENPKVHEKGLEELVEKFGVVRLKPLREEIEFYLVSFQERKIAQCTAETRKDLLEKELAYRVVLTNYDSELLNYLRSSTGKKRKTAEVKRAERFLDGYVNLIQSTSVCQQYAAQLGGELRRRARAEVLDPEIAQLLKQRLEKVGPYRAMDWIEALNKRLDQNET